jgi:hypothetical protein
MSYVPQNLTVFTAAAAGCMSGLVASGRQLKDILALDYSGYGLIANAFAQSFDTAWGNAAPDTLQVFMIQMQCKAVWEERNSRVTTASILPANYTVLSKSIIASVNALESIFAGQSIVPDLWMSGGVGPPGPPGPAGPGGPWTDVAAGATVAVVVGTSYKATSSGALVTFNLPSAPTDGSPIVIKAVGATTTNPIKIVAGAGDVTEDPNAAGTFSAIGDFVVLSTPGALYGIKYDITLHQWAMFL